MDNEQERNEHFKGYATLLYPELAKLFSKLYECRFFEDEPGMKRVEESIKTLLAQHGYDLVEHATKHINKNAIYTEHPRFDAFMLAIVPDLTEWPKTASE